MPVGVKVKNNNVEKALQIFNKKVERAGILKEYRRNQYFTKPSKKRREAKKAAIKRERKRQKRSK